MNYKKNINQRGKAMGKDVVLPIVLIFLTASLMIVPLPVKAGSKTIVVPNDFPTIAVAVENAAEGDTIFVKKGTYEEQTLEISKKLSLIGEDVESTVINLHPPYNETMILTQSFFSYSNAITINANDVRLINLTIVIAAPGGYISAQGDRTQITGNNITTGSETGLSVIGSHCNITDNASGGHISLSGSSNIIVRNSFYTIIINGDSNTIGNNTICNLHLSNANKNIFYENKIGITTFYYNGFSVESRAYSGIFVEGNSSHNVFYANDVAASSYDVEMVKINSNYENNTFYHNNFLNNSRYTGIGIRTGDFANFWDDGKEGNYWEDYNGTDENRDGIGDTPYIIDTDNVDRYPLMVPFDVGNNTVALPPPEPFPTTWVVVTLGLLAVVGAGLLLCFKKRKLQP